MQNWCANLRRAAEARGCRRRWRYPRAGDAWTSRIKAAGIKEPDTYVLDHGYCRSLYAVDPNGMICEFTCDHPDAAKFNAKRKQDAHSELKRWLAGDHRSNNMFR
jgi:hypothetical protein